MSLLFLSLLLSSLLFLGPSLLFSLFIINIGALLSSSFSLGLRLSLSLCLGSGLRFGGSTAIASIIFLRVLFSTGTPQDLLDVRSSVDASSSCLEHVLQPDVGLVRLLTREHHAWLDVGSIILLLFDFEVVF